MLQLLKAAYSCESYCLTGKLCEKVVTLSHRIAVSFACGNTNYWMSDTPTNMHIHIYIHNMIISCNHVRQITFTRTLKLASNHREFHQSTIAHRGTDLENKSNVALFLNSCRDDTHIVRFRRGNRDLCDRSALVVSWSPASNLFPLSVYTGSEAVVVVPKFSTC